MAWDDEAERTGWSEGTLLAARAAHAERLQGGQADTPWRHLSEAERDSLCEHAAGDPDACEQCGTHTDTGEGYRPILCSECTR